MLEFGHLRCSVVRPVPGMSWLCFPTVSKLVLSSDHGLFPLGILDTATPLYEVYTMDMNLSMSVVHGAREMSWALLGARHSL